MTADVVLAADLGSGSCKAVIVDAEGRLVASARAEYPTRNPRPGWAEQAPEDWYRAFCQTVAELLATPGVDARAIRGVGIFGVTHNAVLLGDDGEPLCPSILMFDDRSRSEVATIQERWGDAIEDRTFNTLTTVWTWPQLAWVRDHQPALWRRIRRVTFQKDFVRDRLAPSPVTDTIDAAGTLLYDPCSDAWIEEFVADLGLPADALPRAVHPLECVATVSSAGERETGIRAGTPVITGTTDTAAEMVGSGAVRPGAGIVKLASVGRIAVVTKGPLRHPGVLNYRLPLDDQWYPGTATKYAASAYRWLRDLLTTTDNGADGRYAAMDTAASAIPAGSNGLIFHPHLSGQWAPHWDERMRGAFLGVTTRHGRGHFTRAVLEGVAFAIREALADYRTVGPTILDLRLIGGGGRSRVWSQIAADVLDRDLAVPEGTDAAYGGALLTAMGIGAMPARLDLVEAIVERSQVRRVIPDRSNVALYDALYRVYVESIEPLQRVGHALHEFEARFPQEMT